MGFTSTSPSLRDPSSWYKILDHGISNRNLGCFLADQGGRIVIANDFLSSVAGFPMKFILGQHIADFRARIAEDSFKKTELSEDLYERTDFLQKNNKTKLVWLGFPIELRHPPAGIYFLLAVDRKTPEKDLQFSEIPAIIQTRDRLKNALARLLLDEADLRVLRDLVPSLMEWEDPPFRDHRVIMGQGMTIDELPKPLVLHCRDEEGALLVSAQETSYGDYVLFKKMVQTGARPILVEHSDKKFIYEIFIPLTFHSYAFGWIGIKLPNLATWNTPVRLNFEEIAQAIGEGMGEERVSLGILPRPHVSDGVFDMESFREIMRQMMERSMNPRPFILLRLVGDMSRLHEIRVFLDKSKRPADILTQGSDDFIVLFPDQSAARVNQILDRYIELVGRLAQGKPGIVTGLSALSYPTSEIGDPISLLRRKPLSMIPFLPSAAPCSHEDTGFQEWWDRFLVLKDWA